MKSKKCVRGEVYYIRSFPTVGHEQKSGRPAVIVSNNENNATSGVVEVCYLTLKTKKDMPTHVIINSGPCINSTVLCEQVTSVSEDKIGDYMCFLPDEVMDSIDKALAVSLGLPLPVHSSLAKAPVEAYQATPQAVMDELTALKHENKVMMEELAITKEANSVIKEKNISIRKELESANVRADMYERMYNDLLDRLVKRT